jgi:hypothetical protein
MISQVRGSTFMQFVCIRFLGQPTRDLGNGECYWNCPSCSSDSFHTLPRHPNYRDRAKCWSCNLLADSYDLLALMIPEESKADRTARWSLLLQQWEAQEQVAASQARDRGGDDPGCNGSGNGCGRVRPAAIPVRGRGIADNPRAPERAWSELGEEERYWLDGLADLAHRHGITLDALAAYDRGFREHIARGDAHHLGECEDPECDAMVCRAARGLPPLTAEEIEAGLREREVARRRREAELMKCIMPHAIRRRLRRPI